MIAWLCKIDPATDYNGREVIMDSELEFLDSFNVNGGGGNKFQYVQTASPYNLQIR